MNHVRIRRHAIYLLAAGCLVLLTSIACGQTFEAFTEPFTTVEVSSPQNGRIAEVHVRRGDRVQRLDPLIALDCRVLEASRRLAEKKAHSEVKLQALQVELGLTQHRHEQLLQLLNEGAGNPEEVRRAQANLEVARLNVAAAREERELARLQLAELETRIEQRRVRSPVDGIVTDVFKEVGEYVSESSRQVVTVVQLDRLRATFYLPTRAARQHRVGEVVRLHIVDTGTTVTGEIEYVAPVTEADSGRVRMDVLIDNSHGQIGSGLRCQLEVGDTEFASGHADRAPQD